MKLVTELATQYNRVYQPRRSGAKTLLYIADVVCSVNNGALINTSAFVGAVQRAPMTIG